MPIKCVCVFVWRFLARLATQLHTSLSVHSAYSVNGCNRCSLNTAIASRNARWLRFVRECLLIDHVRARMLTMPTTLTISIPVIFLFISPCNGFPSFLTLFIFLALSLSRSVSTYQRFDNSSLTKSCPKLQSLMVQRCPLVTERVLAPLRGRLHIDRPSVAYNLPVTQHRLYLQV